MGRPARNSRRGAPCWHGTHERPYDIILWVESAYRAVTECDSAGELNEIASSDLGELGKEGDQVVDTVADTEVREEGGFDGRENEH